MNLFENKDDAVLDIQLDPVRDGLRNGYPQENSDGEEEKYYPVIGTNGDSRLATREETDEIMEELGDDAGFLFLGGDHYVAIYNTRKKFTSEGSSYFAGSIVALRNTGKSFEPLTKNEIHRVMDLLMSRMALFIMENDCFTALELD